jgi:hypothetical protein
VLVPLSEVLVPEPELVVPLPEVVVPLPDVLVPEFWLLLLPAPEVPELPLVALVEVTAVVIGDAALPHPER